MTLSIAQENALTAGVQSNIWWLDGVGQTAIPGFVRRSYYTPGETVQLSVDYNSAYTVEVWRLGWYGGGQGNARKVATFAGTPTNQPEAVVIPNSNGAVECSGWSVNNTWAIPADATPGWYHVLLRGGNGTSFSQLIFCVTDTLAPKRVVVVSSDATYGAAYNYYGGKTAVATGKSLYGSNGPLSGGIENRALCVSYDRPVVTREGVAQTYFFNAELPLLRYLERMGIEAGHVTCEQIDADPTVLDDRDVIIIAGHNEYISQPIWDKFTSLKATTTTRLVNLSGNDFFWRTRYGTTTRASSSKGRVLWCSKDTMPGPGAHVAGQPIVAGDWGGTWQDTRWTGRTTWSEQLWGDVFIANGIRNDNLRVPFAQKGRPIWRNCAGIQALTSGQAFTFGAGTLGMEWDIPAGSAEKSVLSSTTVDLTDNSSDANGQNYTDDGTHIHSMFLMATPGKGAVFNAANVQHSWTLDNTHDRGGPVATPEGMQSMLNMLVDLGAEADPISVAAASLTYPTPTADLAAAYGLTGPILPPPSLASPVGPVESGVEVWHAGEWRPAEILGGDGAYLVVT